MASKGYTNCTYRINLRNRKYCLILSKSLPNLAIQNATVQHTASMDQRCEFLNSYFTVLRNSKLETRDSILKTPDSILMSPNSKRSSFKTRGSCVSLLLSGTVASNISLFTKLTNFRSDQLAPVV